MQRAKRNVAGKECAVWSNQSVGAPCPLWLVRVIRKDSPGPRRRQGHGRGGLGIVLQWHKLQRCHAQSSILSLGALFPSPGLEAALQHLELEFGREVVSNEYSKLSKLIAVTKQSTVQSPYSMSTSTLADKVSWLVEMLSLAFKLRLRPPSKATDSWLDRGRKTGVAGFWPSCLLVLEAGKGQRDSMDLFAFKLKFLDLLSIYRSNRWILEFETEWRLALSTQVFAYAEKLAVKLPETENQKLLAHMKTLLYSARLRGEALEASPANRSSRATWDRRRGWRQFGSPFWPTCRGQRRLQQSHWSFVGFAGAAHVVQIHVRLARHCQFTRIPCKGFAASWRPWIARSIKCQSWWSRSGSSPSSLTATRSLSLSALLLLPQACWILWPPMGQTCQMLMEKESGTGKQSRVKGSALFPSACRRHGRVMAWEEPSAALVRCSTTQEHWTAATDW